MSETDMTEYAELRAALAAGPAIGPYIVDQDNGNGIVVVDGRGNIVAEANYGDVPSEYGPGVTETIIRGVRSTLLYIAAANPTTITALLAERDHLAAENARLREALEKIPKGTPVEGEEIMVNTPYDVFTLPLYPSGLSSGPRFVVHVPGPEQPAPPDSGEDELAECRSAVADEVLALLERSLAVIRQDIDDIGGCDHSVGICCCDLIHLANDIRAAMQRTTGREGER